MGIKSKWDEWRDRWFLVEVPVVEPQWEEPKELPKKLDSWSYLSGQDSGFSKVVERIKLLDSKGVTGAVVASHFLRNRIAPL